MSRELPIPFTAPMVLALLREIEAPGTGKTQTRRVLTAACDEPPAFVQDGAITALDEHYRPHRWPRTKEIGDRLYVREHWRIDKTFNGIAPRYVLPMKSIHYQADGTSINEIPHLDAVSGRFRQGMHMPKWASRITLLVTGVRVERLQDISKAGAIAEGLEIVDAGPGYWKDYSCPYNCFVDPAESYRTLWDGLNSERAPWASNPWVAVYEFEPRLGNVRDIH